MKKCEGFENSITSLLDYMIIRMSVICACHMVSHSPQVVCLNNKVCFILFSSLVKGYQRHNAVDNPAMNWHPIQVGVLILLVALCYRNWVKHQKCGYPVAHVGLYHSYYDHQ